MTAMAAAPEASSARKAENRLAAASMRSPDALRLIIGPRMLRHGAAEGQQRLAVAHLARVEPQPGRAARSGAPACPGEAGLSRRRPRPPRSAGRARARCPRAATPPSRSIDRLRARSHRRPSTSRPTAVAPPSRIMATRSPRSASTCAAVVGLTWPERLALGAAIGTLGRAQQRLRDRVRRHAHGDGVEPRRRQLGDRAIRAAWPAPASAAPARTLPPAAGRAASARPAAAAASTSAHVHDQRIEARPALGREDRRHGAAVGGIRAEAVHGLGRKRDQRAAPQRRWRRPRSRSSLAWTIVIAVASGSAPTLPERAPLSA